MQGQGQVVSVVGEAGIGKSRLLHEFKQRLEREDAHYVEGSCFAYGESISYLPFLEILKRLCGLGGQDSEDDAKRRIGNRLTALSLDSSSTASYLHRLLAFDVRDEDFGKLTPELVRQRTVDALKRLVLAEATQRPFAVIIEDVHWIDQATEEVLTGVIGAMASAPLLMVLVYRPEYERGWSHRPVHTQPYASRVSLERLSREQSQVIVQDVLGTVELAPDVASWIAEKADGNPLFMEELTRSLLESGDLVQESERYRVLKPLATLDLPTTVQGVLLARIDRLPDDLKVVVQIASVIGRVFLYPLLGHVIPREIDLDAALVHLTDRDFVYMTSPASREYSFKHVLTQEAVYATLLRRQRETYHEQIGAALEALYADRPEEYYEQLAHHYVRSANKDKAVEYLDQANRKAAKTSAMEEAKRHFDEAMSLLDALPPTAVNKRRRISLLVQQGWVMNALLKIPEYYDRVSRYESTAAELGDPGLLGAFYARQAWGEWSFGDFERAVRSAANAVGRCLAARNFDDAGQAYAHWQWSCLCTGDYDESLRLSAEVLRTLEHHFNPRWHLFARAGASLAYAWLGRWDDGVAEGQKALRMGEQFADNSVIAFSAMVLSNLYTARGDVERALSYGELAVERAPTPGDKIWSASSLGWARCRTGQPRRGVELLRPTVPLQRAARFIWAEVCALWLGEGYWRVGEHEEARRTLEELLETAGRTGMKFLLGSAHRLLGEIAIETDEPLLAAPHFEASVAVLKQIKAENELAHTYAGYGRFHRGQGDQARAQYYLSEALEIYERLGTLIEPDKVRQTLAELERTRP